MDNHNEIPAGQRSEILEAEVARMVNSGWVAESVTQTQAVLFKARRVGWFWHLVATLITSGLWAIVWIILVLKNKGDRIVIYVDNTGIIRKR
jgi:hypothetical protein